MNSIIDPDTAGLAQAASVIGQLSGPQRMPVGIGSILGQAAGGINQARGQAVMQNAQLQQLKDVSDAKQTAVEEQQRQAKAKAQFNSILGELQSSGQPLDEISILGAGIKSGAFGPAETTNFMSRVMEKKSAREQRLEELRIRSEDQKLAREDRERVQRDMLQLRNDMAQDNIRLAASLRGPEPLTPVMENGRVVYRERSKAVGQEVPPSTANRPLPPAAIKDLGEKGEAVTTFNRLLGGFKDEFGGKVSATKGEVENFIGRNLGMGKSDQADWWQDYQNQKNIIRNKLFGSALTATEKDEFDRAAITPGMTAEIIRRNLGRQQDAARRAARKLSKAYSAGGYSDEQIEAAMGFTLADIEGPAAEVPKPAAPKPWEKKR